MLLRYEKSIVSTYGQAGWNGGFLVQQRDDKTEEFSFREQENVKSRVSIVTLFFY